MNDYDARVTDEEGRVVAVMTISTIYDDGSEHTDRAIDALREEFGDELDVRQD